MKPKHAHNSGYGHPNATFDPSTHNSIERPTHCCLKIPDPPSFREKRSAKSGPLWLLQPYHGSAEGGLGASLRRHNANIVYILDPHPPIGVTIENGWHSSSNVLANYWRTRHQIFQLGISWKNRIHRTMDEPGTYVYEFTILYDFEHHLMTGTAYRLVQVLSVLLGSVARAFCTIWLQIHVLNIKICKFKFRPKF